MQICGYNKTTLLDYPEHVAATVFLGGCNFRCPFCHNGDLVQKPYLLPSISMEEVLAFLRKRSGILTGVCITGGEPSLSGELPELIMRIKELGLSVKLDTNGSRPDVLKQFIERDLLDYIAMDIKGDRENYGRIAGFPGSGNTKKASFDLSPIEASISLIQGCGIPYEFRTTVVQEFHSKASFEEISKWLHGSQSYFLQSYEESPNAIQKGFHGYKKEELLEFIRILEPHFGQVGIRGL
ncbi:MAG: anaerobic ribonucleoside-triphosphate reductase activating protein [Roseburia sp.]|nr:anaerobic ribonucleoside-triphosphate reductase activating protein [Roseburia sp.]MCM1278989.1 anaerobic ribonucleoside-triphosphate reductase activating protein [Robinsoniella sp.]